MPPQQFCYLKFFETVKCVNFSTDILLSLYTAKMYSKNYECVIMQVTKGALIAVWKCTKSTWRTQKGSLQCSPIPLAGFKGYI